MDLSFLSNMEVAAAPEKAARIQTQLPINGDIRIHRTGKISFSENFAAIVGEKWLDIFFAHDWVQYDKTQPNVCFINISNDEKPAKADVKSAGTSVFVKNEFWKGASEFFGFDAELSFVDMLMEDVEVKVPIALIPKKVQRGVDKGNITYVQRENVTLQPLTVANEYLTNSTDVTEEKVAEEAVAGTEDDETTDFS